MSGQKPVTPTAKSLAESVEAAKTKGLPPIHEWNPPFCGDLNIRISSDGTWSYLGSPIKRHALVKLFSSILKLENGEYFLVTPVEKVGITVDDVPFVVVDFEVEGSGDAQVLRFVTNVDDVVTAGDDHPMRFETDQTTHEPSPYIVIRNGLEARIDRKSFYRLADLGVHHDDWFGLWSRGRFFPMIPSRELEET